jgi:UDP-GlcNAc3NAcA epimerase
MKIITVLGARPQFIKASALSREFLRHPDITEIILHTGQHFDRNMSDIFFSEMMIPEPKYNLNIHGLSHGAMTGEMLKGIEQILLSEKPDFVLVYGDTNSTLAGALAAQKLHIKIIHVEAGLRSFNMNMPEEVNRILTDRISSLLFCPTASAVENLKSEGFDKFGNKIFLSGDVMLDNALWFSEIAEKKILLPENLNPGKKPYLLCTFHRQENTDVPKNILGIVNALNSLSGEFQIVLPLHPRTRKILENSDLKLAFNPIEPVGYLEMISLIRNSEMILTDSGGLQKESFFFGKYCITLRNETEWTELTDNQVNFITGADSDKICKTVRSLSGKSFPVIKGLYGNGKAAAFICNEILSYK